MPRKLVPLPEGADVRETLARRLRLESIRSPRVSIALDAGADAPAEAYREVLEVADVKHAQHATLARLELKGTEPIPGGEAADGGEVHDAETARLLDFAMWLGFTPAYLFAGKLAVLGWTIDLERDRTELVVGIAANVVGRRYVEVADPKSNGRAS